MSRQDLILLSFGGIQGYIAESHSTADLGNASRIVAELAKKATEALRAEDDCTLVIPSPSTLAGAAAPDASSAEPPNTPSRIVALAPEGMGSEYARRAAEKVREGWRGWISALFRNAGTTPETPGFPDIMWVVAPASAGDYRAQWNLAQTTLAGTIATLSASTWHQALARAGKELRYFRAQEDSKHTNNPRGPHIKTRGWKHVVPGGTPEMPRAALGLPVVYKDKWEVRAFRGSDKDPEQLRRSSPLWIRPVAWGKRWHLFSFAFLNEFLPESGDERVALFKNGQHKKDITVRNDDIRSVANEWIEGFKEKADAFSHDRPQ